MNAYDIVQTSTKRRMSGRPEYYSGRGATLSDLNSELLQMIWKGVKKEVGKKAAAAFVEMVVDIEVLSATCFLNTLYSLEARGWIWTKPNRCQGNLDHIDVGPDGEGRFAVGMASIAAWMGGGSSRDDTLMIRGEFLAKHGKTDKQLERHTNRYSDGYTE